MDVRFVWYAIAPVLFFLIRTQVFRPTDSSMLVLAPHRVYCYRWRSLCLFLFNPQHYGNGKEHLQNPGGYHVLYFFSRFYHVVDLRRTAIMATFWKTSSVCTAESRFVARSVAATASTTGFVKTDGWKMIPGGRLSPALYISLLIPYWNLP